MRAAGILFALLFSSLVPSAIGCSVRGPDLGNSSSILCQTGLCRPGAEVPICFAVKNNFDTNASLTLLGVSCGCMQLELERAVLRPGEQTVVSGVVKAGEVLGEYSVEAELRLRTTDSARSSSIKCVASGIVAEDNPSAAKRFELHEPASGDQAVGRLRVHTASRKEIIKLEAVEMPDWLSVISIDREPIEPCSCSPYEAIEDWYFNVVADTSDITDEDDRFGELVLLSNDGVASQEIEIIVCVIDSVRLSVTPSTIVFRTEGDDWTARTNVRLLGIPLQAAEKTTVRATSPTFNELNVVQSESGAYSVSCSTKDIAAGTKCELLFEAFVAGKLRASCKAQAIFAVTRN